MPATPATPYLRSSHPYLKKFALYLKAHKGVQDSLSIYVARHYSFPLGDVRQMIAEKVERIAQPFNTSSTDAAMAATAEVAEDFVWLMRETIAFHRAEEAKSILPVDHFFPNSTTVMQALSASHKDLLGAAS